MATAFDSGGVTTGPMTPLNTNKQIMEDVNREFGINSKANGIIAAVPTEKAYKI